MQARELPTLLDGGVGNARVRFSTRKVNKGVMGLQCTVARRFLDTDGG